MNPSGFNQISGSNWILLTLAVLVMAWFFLKPSVAATEGSREATGWQLIDSGALLVDVRTPEEFSSGHLDGAINIPHTETLERLADYGRDKDRSIVVYCRSGHRAGLAEEILSKHGFSKVHNAGGYEGMLAAKP